MLLEKEIKPFIYSQKEIAILLSRNIKIEAYMFLFF